VSGARRVEVELPELGHPQPIPVAVWVKDTLFTSPIGPRREDGTVPEDVEEQFDVTFENLGRILAAAGAPREGVAMVRVHLSDPALRDVLNARWTAFFDAPYPARHTSRSELPPGVHVLLTVTGVR
jgi:enamine deaminase RidA (YjgF/YER057c/UK114 family)